MTPNTLKINENKMKIDTKDNSDNRMTKWCIIEYLET